MQSTCSQCNHASYLHDAWSICGVLGCEPCHLKLECARCKHTFAQHTVSDNTVFCAIKSCDFLTCYNKLHPEKPLMKASTARPLRPPVERIPWAGTAHQQTYEDSLSSMLPAIYRNIKPVVAKLPDPGVEKGFIG